MAGTTPYVCFREVSTVKRELAVCMNYMGRIIVNELNIMCKILYTVLPIAVHNLKGEVCL